MFHCSSVFGSGGVPRGAPLGQGPCCPRPAPGAPCAGGLPCNGTAGAAAAFCVGGGAPRCGRGAIQPRYCTPPLMFPVPFISSFSSKSAASPPCQTRYTVPVGFSHVDSMTVAPSSTFQYC